MNVDANNRLDTLVLATSYIRYASSTCAFNQGALLYS